MTLTAPLPRTISHLIVAAAFAVNAVGCGGGGGDSACIKTAKTICAAACGCGSTTSCAIGDANGAVTFDNQAGCVMLYSLGCSQPGGTTDFAACQAALANPTCVQSPDGRALELPAACE